MKCLGRLHGQTWPRDPFKRVGLYTMCSMHTKLAPEANSKCRALVVGSTLGFLIHEFWVSLESSSFCVWGAPGRQNSRDRRRTRHGRRCRRCRYGRRRRHRRPHQRWGRRRRRDQLCRTVCIGICRSGGGLDDHWISNPRAVVHSIGP